jgi:hypothetical protein
MLNASYDFVGKRFFFNNLKTSHRRISSWTFKRVRNVENNIQADSSPPPGAFLATFLGKPRGAAANIPRHAKRVRVPYAKFQAAEIQAD